jgi:hypothetical protein
VTTDPYTLLTAHYVGIDDYLAAACTRDATGG